MSQHDRARPLALLLSAIALFAVVLGASTAHAEEPVETDSYEDNQDAVRLQVVVIVEAPRQSSRLVPLDRRGNPRKALRAVPGEDPPDGYMVETRAMRAVLVPGVVLLPAGYFISAWTSFFDMIGHGPSWEYGFIPLVGPIVAASDRDTSSTARGFYVASAVMQNVGLALTIAGAVTKEERWVRAEEAGSEPSVRVGLQPGGVSVSGSF